MFLDFPIAHHFLRLLRSSWGNNRFGSISKRDNSKKDMFGSISKQENSIKDIFGSISKREKGDVAREDKKIGDHGLITTSTLIDSSAIYNPAQCTLAHWERHFGWVVQKVGKCTTFQFHESARPEHI